MGSIIDVSEILLELGLSASVTDEERAVVNSAIADAEGAVRRHLKYDPVQRSRTEFYPQADLSAQSRGSTWEVDDGQAVLRQYASAAFDELQVQHIPIRSITDLRIDLDGRSGTRSGGFPATAVRTEGVDFSPNYDGWDSGDNGICRDGIIRSMGRWPLSPGTVRIVYVAGYTTDELHGQDAAVEARPIVDAVKDEAIRRVRKKYALMKQAGVGWAAGPLRGERLGDYSYTTDGAALAASVGGMWDILPETAMKLSEFVNVGWVLAS